MVIYSHCCGAQIEWRLVASCLKPWQAAKRGYFQQRDAFQHFIIYMDELGNLQPVFIKKMCRSLEWKIMINILHQPNFLTFKCQMLPNDATYVFTRKFLESLPRIMDTTFVRPTTNKNYYVVRNVGWTHFRNTWKLSLIFFINQWIKYF